MIDGKSRNHLARLSTPQAALQSLKIISYTSGGSVITWKRSGAGPELALPPQLQSSSDGSIFSLPTTLQRISGGWGLKAPVSPMNSTFHLRVQGQVTSGQSNASSGLVESTGQFRMNSHDGIFLDCFE